MTAVVTLVLVLGLLAWLAVSQYLRGVRLTAFDGACGQCFNDDGPCTDSHLAVVASLGHAPVLLSNVPRRQRLGALRDYLDNLFPDCSLQARFITVDAGGVPSEWVCAPCAQPARRMLYLHGGGFVVGSAASHRRLTSRLSALSDCAVLAINYRLMPEHSRQAGIDDCRRAYQWMLGNGPLGAGQASVVVVAGDSAGGNLTLSLIAWVRDQQLRMPDAAVALSPVTDCTLGSPSLRSNQVSDPILGPLVRPLAWYPRWAWCVAGWWFHRTDPRDPCVSPVFGDLSNLPPLLVQASEAEMLRDDARRYVNRARAAGSPVTLQTWHHMVHVWQIFYPELAEGRQALDQIRLFLRTHLPVAVPQCDTPIGQAVQVGEPACCAATQSRSH